MQKPFERKSATSIVERVKDGIRRRLFQPHPWYVTQSTVPYSGRQEHAYAECFEKFGRFYPPSLNAIHEVKLPQCSAQVKIYRGSPR